MLIIGNTDIAIDLFLFLVIAFYIIYIIKASHKPNYMNVEDVMIINKRINTKLDRLERIIIARFKDRDD